MNFRGLMLAVAALVILGGVLYWSQHRKPSSETANTAADASPAILKFDPAEITQLTLKKKDGEPITLARADANQWRITEPRSLNADQDTVTSMVSTLATLNADRLVEEKAVDGKQYGFDQPALEVDITAKGGKLQKLFLGDATPAGGDVYAMLAGNPKIFTVVSYSKTSLDKTLNELRDKRLLTVDPDKVSRVELLKKAQDIEFARSKDGWQILKPRPLRADDSAIDGLVRTLSGGRMEFGPTDTSDAATEFARATPIATAKLTGDAGVQALEVRKNKDEYYAKSSVVDGAYKVDANLGDALEKNLDDFRNKKLFDFGFQEPAKIELHSSGTIWVFTRDGTGWLSNGKKVDTTDVESFISKLRDLTAGKFTDSGFTSPEVEATVTSNDGKRVEKVLISKSNGGYIAKRENEPSLYWLDSTAVTDLTKSADGIKPAVSVGK